MFIFKYTLTCVVVHKKITVLLQNSRMILSILELGMVPCLTFVSRYNGMKEFAEYYARSACLHMG